MNKQQQRVKKYWDDMKKEFEESSETNWDKFLKDRNNAITEKIMLNFNLIEKTETHKIFKCNCGSVVKKRYNLLNGANNACLKSHLKSKKHLEATA